MIENFDVSDSFISEPYLSTYGLTLAKFVSLGTSKSLPPIRIDGDLKVIINKNGDKKSFLLAISVDETNEEFFKRLEFHCQDWRVWLYSAPNAKISS